MFVVVTGGSGSGKSAYAEKLTEEFGGVKKYYIATMLCADEESEKRVKRHRKMREGRRFETLECPVDVQDLEVEEGCTALLECMSNLAANEYFDGEAHTPQEVADKILGGIRKLRGQCRNLVVVTNEVFSDGVDYDPATGEYLRCLALVNCAMAREADQVTEVVFGIPLSWRKIALQGEK